MWTCSGLIRAHYRLKYSSRVSEKREYTHDFQTYQDLLWTYEDLSGLIKIYKDL